MKLENVKVGAKVRVKTEMNNGVLSFYLRHRGAVRLNSLGVTTPLPLSVLPTS